MGNAWQGSDRRSRLPSDWAKRVAHVKERDGYTCVMRDANGVRCTRKGVDVDHIKRGDNHAYSNLQLLCRENHTEKTTAEAAEARREEAKRFRYPKERHPGLIR